MRNMLRRLGGGNLGTALIAGLVAALVASTAVYAGGKFFSAKTYRKAEKRQNKRIAATEGIFSSFKNGPVDIPNAETTLARLSVPAGSYAINAKLYGTDTTSSPAVTCRLIAGVDFDTTRGNVLANNVPFALQVVHTFATPATVTLACGDTGSTTDTANFLKITAIRSGSLANTPSP